MAKDSHANSIASIQRKLRPKTFEVGAGVFLDPVEMSDQTQDSRDAAVPAPPSKVHLLTWLCAEVRDERVDDPAQEELHDPAILFWPRHFPSSRRPDVNLEKNQHLRRAVSFAVARPEKSRSKYVKVRLVWNWRKDGCRTQEANQMPLYMDRHNTVGITPEVIVASHVKDLAIQGKYGVRFITYWYDEVRSKAFCLVDAPNKDALQKVHDEAHGGIANEIIEVDPAVVEAFLGRVTDPPPIDSEGRTQLHSASRAIMFTDLQDSTAMTTRLGEAKAMDLLHTHNSLTRKALREYTGREVKHLGDGIMASFASIDQSLECAIAIQRAFASYNVEHSGAPLHLRIGLSVGEPVEDDNDLFGRTVQLACRVCTHAKPDQILATEEVVAQSAGKTSLFLSRGPISPKGFDQAIQVYEVLWG